MNKTVGITTYNNWLGFRWKNKRIYFLTTSNKFPYLIPIQVFKTVTLSRNKNFYKKVSLIDKEGA